MSLLDFMDESSEMFEEAMKTADDFRAKKREENSQRKQFNDSRAARYGRVVDNDYNKSTKDAENVSRKSDDYYDHKKKYGDHGNVNPYDAQRRHDRKHTNESFIELF